MHEVRGESGALTSHSDPFVLEMRAYRLRAGSPSYESIAKSVSGAREAAGQSPYAARVARSTVYDAFRLGRPRVKVTFLREIARAMGVADPEIERWVAACGTPRVDAPDQRTDVSAYDVPAAGTGAVAPAHNAPQQAPAALEQAADRSTAMNPTRRQALILMLACLGLNLLGREFVDFFHLPLHLDMVGTAIAAIALGPWRGAAVGAATNTLGAVGSGLISLPFGIVNVAGALVWGYGVQRWGWGRNLHRFFALNLLTALVCTVLAVPVIVAFLGNGLRVGHDMVTQLVQESVGTFAVALGLSNILTSLADKLLSGFLTLVVVSSLPLAFRCRFPVAMVLHALADERAPAEQSATTDHALAQP